MPQITVNWDGISTTGRTPSGEGQQEDLQYQHEHFLARYFRRSVCHTAGSTVQHTANFYTQLRIPVHDCIFRISGPAVHTVFYDSHLPIRTSTEEGRSGGYNPLINRNVLIIYNDRPCAVLDVDRQVLFASDWAHCSELRPATAYVLQALEFANLLRPHASAQPQPRHTEPEPPRQRYTITMGGDPEFELIYRGDVITASDHVSNHNYDRGNIGRDGSGQQVELRPSPGTPADVVRNIHTLLNKFKDNYPSYRLAASSDRFPCGGHIHIGVRPNPGEQFFTKLCPVLDYFIGSPTRQRNGTRRGDGQGYGRSGDWRQQPHGMEYRVPPAAVWESPLFCTLSLKIAYALADKLLHERTITYGAALLPTELVSVCGLTDEEATAYVTECNKPRPTKRDCLMAAWNIEVPAVSAVSVPTPTPQPVRNEIEFETMAQATQRAAQQFREQQRQQRQQPVPRPTPEPEERPELHNLTLSDDWHPFQRRHLVAELTRLFPTGLPVHVHIYGLAINRGEDVCTAPVPNWPIVPHPIAIGDAALTIGLAANIRVRTANRNRNRLSALARWIAGQVLTMIAGEGASADALTYIQQATQAGRGDLVEFAQRLMGTPNETEGEEH